MTQLRYVKNAIIPVKHVRDLLQLNVYRVLILLLIELIYHLLIILVHVCQDIMIYQDNRNVKIATINVGTVKMDLE
jgi:hypothetical protein